MANKLWIGIDGNYGANANWSPANVPAAADHVRIPAGAGKITAGLNQSAVAIGDFIVEEGFTDKEIGVAQTPSAAASYLQIDPDKFEFAGSGTKGAYIDLGAAAIPVQVLNSPIAQAAGLYGLYLKGSALTTLNLIKGTVALAGLFTETSTVTTARVGSGSKLYLGSGVTITTLEIYGGEVIVNCAVTNLIVWDGKVTTWGSGTITTADLYSGDGIFNSTGTITTLNLRGGNADFLQSGAARTVTNVNLYKRGGRLLVNKNAVTLTNGLTPQENLTLGL